MLVEHRSPTFEQLTNSLSMRVQLTDGLREMLNSQRGPTSTNPFEMRGTSRFRCFGKCVINMSPESFHMPGQDAQSMAIIRDISRTGIGLIAHQQWYPEQLMQVLLENASMDVRVARARRAGPFCFEVGLIIAKHLLQS